MPDTYLADLAEQSKIPEHFRKEWMARFSASDPIESERMAKMLKSKRELRAFIIGSASLCLSVLVLIPLMHVSTKWLIPLPSAFFFFGGGGLALLIDRSMSDRERNELENAERFAQALEPILQP